MLTARRALFALVLVGMVALAWVAAHDKPASAQTVPPGQTVPVGHPQGLPPGQTPDGFTVRPVIQELNWPLEILYGPDGFLWVTERAGKRVVRIDPETGERSIALTVRDAHQNAAQDGVLGMVFHPELLQGTGNDYVYLAYTYVPDDDDDRDDDDVDDDVGDDLDDDVNDDDIGDDDADDIGDDDIGDDDADDDDDTNPLTFRRVKIQRYTYVSETQILTDPVDLITNLSGSSDHNAGKLAFGPDNKLYYTIGEQGNNQFARACLPILAQEIPTAEEVNASDWRKYVGKILRMNLDGSIPDDNPVINGVRSHIYSYGHRNIQGLAFSPDGKLYATEHGPKSDDEVNQILPGKNYGWPHVAGYQDDQGYVYANWSAAEDCASLTFSNFEIPPSVPVQQESEWNHPDFVPPIYTFGTVPDDYDFQPQVCAPNFFICWPTVAPTGLEVYSDPAGIPGWSTSLLVTSLKTGTVYRLMLNEDGTAVVGTATAHVASTNRYRDLIFGPDPRTFYVITDSGNSTQGAFGLPTAALQHPGSVLEFTWTESGTGQ